MIAFLILASLLTAFIPVNPAIIDLLLVVNFGFSLTLILLIINSTDTLRLSTLPTLLLLATFLRLCTNITTTRCILINGDAGNLIRTFGEISINQNLLIGTVIFLVITIVQFVVISKGGERIAEVSARFSLDALPGKQMSIDADLRSGAIDFETAKQKREDLQLESKFYGSLDGAMKFIKGDAIVFIFISLINISFGLLTGIINGLSPLAALNKFSILTIGDGLFAQAMSLLCSLGAVMLITRSSRESKHSFSEEIRLQVFQNRKITFSVLTASIVLSTVTGAFLTAVTLVLICGITICMGYPKGKTGNHVQAGRANQPIPNEALLIILKEDLSEDRKTALADYLSNLIYQKSGVILPMIKIFSRSQKQDFQLCYRGNLIAAGVIAGQLHDKNNLQAAIADKIYSEVLAFVNDNGTKRLLDFFEVEYSELINSLFPQVITTTQLTLILKQLLEEGVSIRDFPAILQALSENLPKFGLGRQLHEEIRISLNLSISQSLVKESLNGSSIDVINLDPRTDYYFTRCEREGKLPNPRIINQLISNLKDLSVNNALLVTSRGARKLVSEIIYSFSLQWPVYAAEELRRLSLNVVRTLSFNTEGYEELT